MPPFKKPELYTGKVKRVRKGREIQILDFECDRPVEFTAGQFLMLDIGDNQKRAYSIASAPVKDHSLQLLVGNVVIGAGTKYLCSLQEGDTIKFLCPLGMLGFLDQQQDETVCIGTSTGLAPLRSIILDQLYKGQTGKLTLIYGNRYEDNMLYEKELQSVAKNFPNFTYQNILSRSSPAWKGRKGYVTEILKEMPLTDGKKRLFYICGGQAVINDVRAHLLSEGIAKEQIRFESFG